jgi:hypothetical protein
MAELSGEDPETRSIIETLRTQLVGPQPTA